MLPVPGSTGGAWTPCPAQAQGSSCLRGLITVPLSPFPGCLTELKPHFILFHRGDPCPLCSRVTLCQVHKLLIVVELLLGEIPDRLQFRQPSLKRSLMPYFLLTQGKASVPPRASEP